MKSTSSPVSLATTSSCTKSKRSNHHSHHQQYYHLIGILVVCYSTSFLPLCNSIIPRIPFVPKNAILSSSSSLSENNHRIIHSLNKKDHVLESILNVQRGGWMEEDEEDEEEDEEEDYEDDEDEDEDEDEYDEEDEEEEYDEEDEYDDEDDEEEEDEESTGIAISSSSSSNNQVKEEYDEPISLSPMIDMGITLGVMVLCNKLDLTNTKIIRMAR